MNAPHAWLAATLLAVTVAAAPAQSGDPSGPSFAFVQSGPAGCPASATGLTPGFDPSFSIGCWLPPSQYPPLEVATPNGSPLLLRFRVLRVEVRF